MKNPEIKIILRDENGRELYSYKANYKLLINREDRDDLWVVRYFIEKESISKEIAASALSFDLVIDGIFICGNYLSTPNCIPDDELPWAVSGFYVTVMT